VNFKQNSLFKRNTELEEEQEVMKGGVLAVWGSPSSGKTTVSVKLADYLARKKKNVLLIFADMTTPPLPCICAAGDLEGEKSLGSILAATHVTENLIKKNCMFYRKNDYLSMVGMLKGENVFTYPPYDQTQAVELIEQAREVAPFVIIDCGSTIASDVLSAVALMEADTVLRLVNCDLKSISYLSSQLPLLRDNKWDAIEKDNNTVKKHTEKIRQILSFMPYAEILFISAKSGQRLNKIFEMIDVVIENNSMRVATGVLNEIVTEAVAMQQPPTDKGKRLKIYYMTQASVKPPTFVCFVNSSDLFHLSYPRYLENRIRDT